MITSRLRARWTLLALLVSACASVESGDGFSEVQALLSERSGFDVHWNHGGPPDAEVEARVETLLSGELSSDAAVQVALLNNRGLQATYEELGIARAEVLRAALLPLPILDAAAKFPEGGGQVELDLGISQNILGWLLRPLRRRAAAEAFEAAKLRVAGAVLDLAGSVRTAFHELQGEQQLLELRRTILEATEASSELARRLHEAGNIRDLDLAAERALHEEARVEVSAAELAVAEARERLNTLMGLWGKRTSWTFAPRLPEPGPEPLDLVGLESRAIERSLELAAIRHEIELLARRADLARPSALADEASQGAVAERGSDGDWSAGLALALPIPILDVGRPARERAQAELRRLQQQYAAEAVRIRSEVRAGASRVAALLARVEHYRAVLLPLQQEIAAGMQLQYNAMQVGAFQLLQAKRAQIEAGSRHVETLRDYWIARTDLDQLLGGRRGRFERMGARLASNGSGNTGAWNTAEH